MSPRLRRFASLVLATVHAAQVTGCTSWHPSTDPIPQSVQASAGNPIRITLQDGKHLTLGGVQLVSDTLRGVREGDMSGTLQRIPQDQIRGIELRHANTGGTVALVTGTVVVVGLGIATLVGMQSWMNESSCWCGYARQQP